MIGRGLERRERREEGLAEEVEYGRAHWGCEAPSARPPAPGAGKKRAIMVDQQFKNSAYTSQYSHLLSVSTAPAPTNNANGPSTVPTSHRRRRIDRGPYEGGGLIQDYDTKQHVPSDHIFDVSASVRTPASSGTKPVHRTTVADLRPVHVRQHRRRPFQRHQLHRPPRGLHERAGDRRSLYFFFPSLADGRRRRSPPSNQVPHLRPER